MMRLVAAAVLAGVLAAGTAQAACRQALALGLDVSGSVDLREYRLQLDGLVGALNDPAVTRVLLAEPSAPVMLMVFEWSGLADQAVIVPWTEITDRAAIDAVSTALARAERRPASPGTALGIAMQLGALFLDEKQDCWKRTLDISGDGKSNFGPRPRDVRPAIAEAGITVNALVIGVPSPTGTERRQADIDDLLAYFEAEVIAGPDAFVQPAQGFEVYQEAMTLKLRRELSIIAVSRLSPVDQLQ